MNKQYLSLALLCSIAGMAHAVSKNDSCDLENTSKTYLAPMPHFQLASPEYITAFRSDRIRMQEDCWAAGFELVLFGSRSTNSDDLARYFFPEGKTSLIVGEDIGVDTFDILAGHFNIFSAPNEEKFLSTISIRPKQTVFGVGFAYRQSFCRNEEKNRGFWFAASAPLMHVKNNMHLKEKVTRKGTIDKTLDENVVSNMIEAFNQKEWKYGKIDTDSRKKTALGFIDVQLGYEKLCWEPCHMETYIGVHLPTGNTAKGEYVFEPVVGHGKHFGLLWGSSLGVHLWDSCCNNMHVRMEYSAHAKYLFEKEQIRSFDLRNKPWSRYIEVYANVEQAQEAADANQREGDPYLATPGINVFTQPVDVTPGFLKDITTALVIDWKDCYQLEGGYRFHSRPSECVELANKWKNVAAIKDIDGRGTTNPIRDITGNVYKEFAEVNFNEFILPVPVADYDMSIITEDDLDLTSAATPCMQVHTLYASGTYEYDNCNYPMFVNIGGSYTFSGVNNAVHDRWTLWLKGGVSF